MSTIVTFGLGKEHGGENVIGCGTGISLSDTNLDLFILNTGTVTLANGTQEVDVFFDDSLTIPDVYNTDIIIN